MAMLTPYRPSPEQPWNIERVVHLHRRAGFAANWRLIQRDLGDGPETSITRLLQGNATASVREAANGFEQMSSVIRDAAVASGDINRLKAWWFYRMLATPDPLGERLTLMWHNHFATSHAKVADVKLMEQQNAIFRQFSRAPFGEMLRRVAKDPALLVWLDADTNRKQHPNENLARELMELFTLGVGNYSEQDVREAARALSGWSVNRGKFLNDESHHDESEKSILGKVGKWTGDDLVRLLLEHPATARRLAFRICELLMGEESNTSAIIDELATGLRERDLDMAWAVETLLRSEAFFSDHNLRTRVLGPIELIVGAIRALEITNPPPSTLLLAEASARLGQDLFVPPNVFGWPGGRSWLTSRAIIGRADFASALVQGNLHASRQPFDAAALAEMHGFTAIDEIGTFYAPLLLGRSQMPADLRQHLSRPNDFVVAMLASPEAQLG